MRRIAAFFLLSVLVSACSSVVDSVEHAAEAEFHKIVANQFSKRLLSGIDLVITQLSQKGGFLDDPLVRILLPPPLGLALGIARDLQENPEAALMETLLNQAAEHAIPVAGPILKDMVMNMDTPSLEQVFKAGDTATTDYLQEKGGEAVKQALLPVISEQLHLNGAIELYGKLLDAKQKADQLSATTTAVQQKIETTESTVEAVESVSQEQLGQYVAEQAMFGLFKKVAAEELSVRRGLNVKL